MALHAITLLGLLTFSGGSPAELMRAVSPLTRSAIVVAAEPGYTIPKARIEFENDLELGSRMRNSMQLRRPDSYELVFAQPRIPERVLLRNEMIRLENQPDVPEVAHGRITLSKEGAWTTPRTLANLELSKPLKVHWLYRDLVVYIRVEREREAVVLKQIAAAVGADFYDKPAEYEFSFSPREFRSRAIETYRHLGREDRVPFTREDTAFAVAALNAVSDEDLTKAYAQEDGQVQVDMKASSVAFKCAIERLNRDYAAEIEGKSTSGSARQGYDYIVKNVDFTRDGRIWIRPGFRIAAMFRCHGENKWFSM